MEAISNDPMSDTEWDIVEHEELGMEELLLLLKSQPLLVAADVGHCAESRGRDDVQDEM